MEPDFGAFGPTNDRELHLIAVAVGLRRGQNRPQLEVAEPADALETIAHLLGLEAELRGVRQVLEPTAAAAAEVGAGRLHPIGRRTLDSFDGRPPEPRPRLDHFDPHPITWDRAAHEEDVTLHSPDALAPEGEVVDRQVEDVAAARFCHD